MLPLLRSSRALFLFPILFIIGTFLVVESGCCFSKATEASKAKVQRTGPPEKFIVSRGGTADGQGAKTFETFYFGEGCSYFPHSWRNSIDAFYTSSDKDCIEICSEDWCEGCSKVPHAVKKGQDAQILSARAELGKLAKTFKNCKK